MAQFDFLRWKGDEDDPDDSLESFFVLDPIMGLSDIDFHKITEDGWKNMRSPRPGATATLITPPGVTLKELQQALGVLESKGDYRSVIIRIRER